jgi:hypothetical protein
MFGTAGRRVLAAHEKSLFPATVQPRFLAVLWLVLIALGIAGAVLVAVLGGRLA